MGLNSSVLRTKPIVGHIDGHGLKRSLTSFDLTMLGIGAIIGAGIFVLTGKTAANAAGPAIILSFVLAGFACACAALSYAEMAASVGGAGSAYGYGYATLGELPAWVICWMLICEYTVAVAAVSVGWSGYFNDFLIAVFGSGLPDWLRHGPFDLQHPGLINLPAATIIALLGILLATGAKSSARFNAVVVVIKLLAIAIFIGVAIPHVDPANWRPFIPPKEVIPGSIAGFSWEMRLVDLFHYWFGDASDGATRYGIGGVIGGASFIFFAYLGFDAVSTSAEETANPQRDLPIGILSSLLICTALYIVVSALLTGVVSYKQLNVDAPVSFALLQIGEQWAAGMISVGAVAGLTTVMLVMYYGQTRVLMAVSRDGLLPRFLSAVDAKSGSPKRSIMLTGVVMVLLGGFMPLQQLGELANIGTLGAFIVVCIGVIVLRRKRPDLARPFRVPLFPLVPLIGTASCVLLILNLAVFTWAAFAVWMGLGLLLYFGYSRSHSLLAR
jgi:APA family basic amino acid/polyamine antiporter